ncbi:hypothetical protein JMJ77_0000451 [Colletotrichum scovillei]|uniref:Uncharacterized protein n=1 Tax=Colletotrichum scovillei TaxID=1209932 RepID=A0A9P7UHD0_9PEZI|nr:hypothetical protein JMJ77_0000451 [Colletotrichum scovillei]KAG7071656.1 hypothetical protein JMJ76_0004526 [Colletotrichum scovillei]KAG7079905.1 hypothetical protein JMJ78_0007008 [Colletotrichum scovillei]
MLATFVDLDVHGVMDAARNKLQRATKKEKKESEPIDTHPFHAPKGKTAKGDEIITALYTAPLKEKVPLSLRKGIEDINHQPGWDL